MTTKKGTPGNDTLNGSALRDRLFGDLGNDVVNGLAGRDRLFGGEGNDRIDGGLDNDHVVGGIGADTLLGGDGDDSLEHAGGFNVFGGDTQKDVLNGGNGNDILSIGAGETAIGGTGLDVLNLSVFSGPGTAYRLNFTSIGGAPVSIGAAGTSFAGTRVGSTESVNAFIGNALPGSAVIGSNGDDTLSLDVAFTAPGTQGITLAGGNGDDILSGSAKNDTVNGGAGHDDLGGGFGGSDLLVGGLGEDAFLFDIDVLFGVVADRVSDFTVGQDIISVAVNPLSGLNFGNQANLLLKTATPVNGTTAAGTGQFIYETDTGRLYIDANGQAQGGLTQIATLVNKANISAADIVVQYDIFA